MSKLTLMSSDNQSFEGASWQLPPPRERLHPT